MITFPELAARELGSFLAEHIDQRFGAVPGVLSKLIPSLARLALECIGNSDALYHNVEHTMLVTLAGHDLMQGRAFFTATPPIDYAHVIAACLFHDIGYVRGILKGDDADGCVINAKGQKAKLPRGSSDAALSPYHVERSKLFVLERLAATPDIDASRLARAIEFTRFPTPPEREDGHNDEGLLLRAADLIGQLGDPNYLRKANALYYEFEEVGMNKQLGYSSAADLIDSYPHFYWNNVSAHIQPVIRYLNVTPNGRQWIANLYSNVFRAGQDQGLSGPQCKRRHSESRTAALCE